MIWHSVMLLRYQSLQLIYLLDFILLLLHRKVLLKMIIILLILSLGYKKKKRRYYITYNKILFLILKHHTLTINIFLLLKILKLHQIVVDSIYVVFQIWIRISKFISRKLLSALLFKNWFSYSSCIYSIIGFFICKSLLKTLILQYRIIYYDLWY